MTAGRNDAVFLLKYALRVRSSACVLYGRSPDLGSLIRLLHVSTLSSLSLRADHTYFTFRLLIRFMITAEHRLHEQIMRLSS